MSKESLYEIAVRLGFKVNQMCEIMGYSRQYLYLCGGNRFNPYPPRMKAAIQLLTSKIDAEYEADQSALEKRYAERYEALQDLERMMLETEADDAGTD